MSEYQVLARKYRPKKFQDVVAQTAIVATLKNAILHERTAHAYLFCGTRGTGKTTLARLFAKALNCAQLSKQIEPCNECPSCREIAQAHAIDVLEIDGASHRGIEDIRQINETIGFSPTKGKYKIYLIDEVHMLTKEAFNALLKTLEEPPAHVKFFFCTTEPHKIPATILSRCQRFNLKRIPVEKIRDQLAHIAQDVTVKIDREALEIVAGLAEGSLRDALSILDQIIAFEKAEITGNTVTEILGLPSKEMLFAFDKAGKEQDFLAPFRLTEELFASGKNISYFLEELTTHFRLLFLIKHGLPHTSRDQKKYEEAASYYRHEQLIQILEYLSDAQQSLKFAPSEKTALEMLLLRILRTHQQISLESLVERLVTLEHQCHLTEDPIPKPEELPEAPKPTRSPSQSEVDGKTSVFDQEGAKQKANFKPSNVPSAERPVVQKRTQVSKAPSSPSVHSKPKNSPTLSLQEESRFDTVMRFAAKELNGSLKKE